MSVRKWLVGVAVSKCGAVLGSWKMLLVAACMLAASSADAELVVNGSFENPTLSQSYGTIIPDGWSALGNLAC